VRWRIVAGNALITPSPLATRITSGLWLVPADGGREMSEPGEAGNGSVSLALPEDLERMWHIPWGHQDALRDSAIAAPRYVRGDLGSALTGKCHAFYPLRLKKTLNYCGLHAVCRVRHLNPVNCARADVH
jgi:hypothetical protein